MSRDHVLHKIRTALGRNAGQPTEPPPPVRLQIPEVDLESRIASFRARVEALAGKTHRAADGGGARDYVASVAGDRPAIASNAPFLVECGITSLTSVRSGVTNRAELRALCSTAAAGITSADYALADTGTLVMLASREEARLISLLPPVHIAVVAAARILTGLDELLSILPDPMSATSSMVLITGPSRTADIEQILVRGVHGPGEIHVVVVG
ncbi:MAG: LutC/YkgG family protein [Bryobacteraceae bacterium]